MLATIQPIPSDGVVRESRRDLPVPNARELVSTPFSKFLEAHGGLHLELAEFLKWRSDLLRGRTLQALSSFPAPTWTLPRTDAAAVLREDFGEAAAPVIESLSETPCWTSAASCAYRARFQYREVVLQFSRPARAVADFANLAGTLRSFPDPELEGGINAFTLVQFKEWTRIGLSPGAGRRLLDAVKEYGGTSTTLFPETVAPLCSDRILAYTWLEGTPLSELMAAGQAETQQKRFESLLELVCLFSVVDAEARIDNLVLTPEGRVGLRIPPRFLAVPPVHLRRMLKYISAIFAVNVPASAHSLLRMSGSEKGDDASMLSALASVEPDLKVNMVFPVSAAQFENHWRALAALQPARPLFLDCLHRNFIAAGYAAALHPASEGDPIEQAHWPVLGRLLRSRFGDLLTRESASDWVMGSGLLLVEAVRQLGRVAEDFRDDDMSMRVDLSSAGGNGEGSARHSADRSTALMIAGGLLLAILLLSLRWGFALSGPWAAVAAVAGALSALGLFLVVSQIE